MTAPMSGRDTKAAYKGLVIGAIAVGLVIVTIVTLVNRKFESHEATPAAAQPH